MWIPNTIYMVVLFCFGVSLTELFQKRSKSESVKHGEGQTSELPEFILQDSRYLANHMFFLQAWLTWGGEVAEWSKILYDKSRLKGNFRLTCVDSSLQWRHILWTQSWSSYKKGDIYVLADQIDS